MRGPVARLTIGAPHDASCLQLEMAGFCIYPFASGSWFQSVV